MVRVRRAGRRGVREEPAFYSPSIVTGSNLVDLGRKRCVPVPSWWSGNSRGGMDSCQGGCGEGLRRTRGDAAGAQSGSSFDRANSSEHGNRPRISPRRLPPTGGWGWAHRPPIGPGRGGAAVVLRAGESPRTWGRAAAVSRREGGCNAGRRAAEWRCSAVGPWAVVEGIGDAGQASPLGGGRSGPPVR